MAPYCNTHTRLGFEYQFIRICSIYNTRGCKIWSWYLNKINKSINHFAFVCSIVWLKLENLKTRNKFFYMFIMIFYLRKILLCWGILEERSRIPPLSVDFRPYAQRAERRQSLRGRERVRQTESIIKFFIRPDYVWKIAENHNRHRYIIIC